MVGCRQIWNWIGCKTLTILQFPCWSIFAAGKIAILRVERQFGSAMFFISFAEFRAKTAVAYFDYGCNTPTLQHSTNIIQNKERKLKMDSE